MPGSRVSLKSSVEERGRTRTVLAKEERIKARTQMQAPTRMAGTR